MHLNWDPFIVLSELKFHLHISVSVCVNAGERLKLPTRSVGGIFKAIKCNVEHGYKYTTDILKLMPCLCKENFVLD